VAHATSPVGATPGSFAVSPSGAATYSIPIFVPPGTNGMQPQLSLNYNSQGENGLLGMGWSIGGLSAIHRCGSTIAIDGTKGGINYGVNDRFCLDGERLIYDSSSGFYRTQHESWQKIVAIGGTASDPGYFTVTTKDGTIRYYGATPDSRIEAQGKTVARIWALNKIEDRNTNYLTVAYQENNANSDFRPDAVSYTGNSSAVVTPYNAVRFYYETRPDVVPYYEGGSVFKTTQRLKSVRTYAGATLVKEYLLAYDNDGVGGRSRLNSMQECGSDGVCLPATSFFNWSGGGLYGFVPNTVFGWQGGGKPDMRWFNVTDVNGDGKDDLISFDPSMRDSGNNPRLRVSLATGNGSFAQTPVESLYMVDGTPSPANSWFKMADINGDGLIDAVLYSPARQNPNPAIGNLNVGLATGNGFFNVQTDFSFVYNPSLSPSNSWFEMADVNGDGRADAVLYNPAADTLTVALAVGAGTTSGPFFGTSLITSSLPANASPSTAWFTMADVNGDGRADAVLYNHSTAGTIAVALSNGNGSFGTVINTTGFANYSALMTPDYCWFSMGDINGDGQADAVFYNPWVRTLSVGLAMGNGRFAGASDITFGPAANGGQYPQPTSTNSWFMLADMNHDNQADAVLMNSSITVVFARNGGFAAPVEIQAGLGGTPSDAWTTLGDMNGDGASDAIRYTSSGIVSISQSNDYCSSLCSWPFLYGIGFNPDLLQSFADGLGVQTTVAYKQLTDSSVYTNGSGSLYPYRDLQNATSVVARSTHSNGIGGTNSANYWYSGLRWHHGAYTSLGFASMQTTDPAGIVNVTYRNQTFDGTEGTVVSSVATYGGQTLKSLANSWVPVSMSGGRTWAKLASTTEQANDLDGTSLPTITTTYNYATAVSPTYAYGGSPTSVDVTFSDGWTKTTDNTYNNDTVNWQLGQLLQSQVTANAPGQTAQTRTSSFTYDALGRLATEVIEPNGATLKLTTTYGYDGFGNRSSKTVSGPDITTRTEYYDYTDGRGQFMTSSRNALTHPTSYTYDLRTGAVKTVTDPNNITTTFTYNDGFGRKTQESRPGSPTTDIYYECWNGSIPGSGLKCPAPTGPAITQIRTVTNGAGTNYAFHDILGRVVQTNTQGFGGNYTYKVTQYDNLGRVASVSHPYFAGEEVHCATYGYDALGRVLSVTEPGPNTTDCANTTGGRVTTTTYNGLSTTVTTPPTTASPSGQAKTTVKNSQGLVATVTDNAGTITNTYDPFGNLLRVAKSFDAGADVEMGYDLRGRKTYIKDPDMGTWSYKYNTLGELVEQKNAKLQTISMTYDVLGRMKTRVLPFGEFASTWNYDTATYGKGKLASGGDANATETYVYDSLSRVSSQTTSISGITYTTSYTYDAYSRLLTLTYPITGFKIYHVYNAYGYLTEIRKDTATGLRYWKADSFDAHSRLTKETLGNSLISQRAYDHRTGDLLTIKTGTSTNPTSVQNSSFIFDALDNLTYRSWYDGTSTRSETFDYDNLNRLTTITGPVNRTISYHANGNISLKSGVGLYVYPTNGIRPHAVSSLAFIGTSYTYDANGNLTGVTGTGAKSIAYTSFNKPKTISNASGTTTFTYDANYNRLIKAAPGGTTTYIGKLYEKFVSGSTTTQKNYIYAGNNLVGVFSTLSNGTSNTRYFQTDHLGSVEVITNESGGVVQRLSYDAWGKRRNPNGTDAISITAQTTRGFTRHEHDDEAGLVNMNAREYDPLLGRFITPDTIIPSATNSQAYNRYSYVINNPLSLTDPTGHSWLSRAVRSVTRSVRRVVNQFTQQVARSTTHALQKVSGVKYVGGLLSTGLLAGTHFGYAYGASTGDWRTVGQAHKQGAILTASAFAFGYVGDTFTGATNIFGHGVVGGTSSWISGGDFRSGFIGSAFGAFASPVVNLIPGSGGGAVMSRVVLAGAIGGAASHLSGGDFGSGFVTAAFGRLFNHEANHCKQNCDGWRRSGRLDSPDRGGVATNIVGGQELHIHAGTYTAGADGIWFSADWRALDLDGTLIPQAYPYGWSSPLQGSKLLPGLEQQYYFNADYSNAINYRWNISVPPQESSHGNSSGNYLDIFTR
jgi:RHS repeat-associated protein